MKKLILTSALTLLSPLSHADWTIVATTGIQDYYIDFKNVVIEGDFAKSMRLSDYYKEHRTNDGRIYWSTIAIYTYDCKKKMQKVELVNYSERMGAGDRLDQDQFVSDWEVVAGSTFNENYMIRACRGGD